MIDRTQESERSGNDANVMLRRLSLPTHGVIELVAGIVLIGLPFVLGFGPAALLASAAAGAVLAGLGLSEGLSISAHMAADTAVAAALLGGAVPLAATGETLAAGMLTAAAAGELTLGMATRWTRAS